MYDFERPEPMSKLHQNLIAVALLSLTALGTAVAYRAAEPVDPLSTDYSTPATMEDVNRWAAQGCSTTIDCARLQRWTDDVCADAEACEIVIDAGLVQ